MTETQLRRLVRTWARRLGLDRWQLRVEISDLDESCSAVCSRSMGYDRATLRFQPWTVGRAPVPEDWPGIVWSDRELEQTVVHELLHCAARDMRHALSILEDVTGRAAFTVAEEHMSRVEEQTVDRLSRALVEAWPR